MYFNSYIFILLFLPVVISIYTLLGIHKKKNIAAIFLLIASFIFYGYNDTSDSFILLMSIFVNYVCYVEMGKTKRIWLRKMLCMLGVFINLLFLLYFKYFNFFAENFNLLLRADIDMREIILPLGISFITFQQIAFLVDGYKGEIPKCSIVDYSLFITYFPHISSGPIIVHKDFFPQWNKIKDRIDWDKFATGIYMFAMGLGKKVLIADTFAKAVNWGYSNISGLNTTSAIYVVMAYSIQIYFDFSGYSDMAIGISRMLQMELPVNFNSPYKAKNILEFWDRWHITLTRFFSKYLYIPLGGNRKGVMRTYLNTLIVFLCSGFWHGANWTFIIWGLLHGCFMIITKQFKTTVDKIPDWINRTITFSFVTFAWILFRAGNFQDLKGVIGAIGKNEWGRLNENISDFFRLKIFNTLLGCNIPDYFWAFLMLVVTMVIIFKCNNVQERALTLKYTLATGIWIVLVLTISVLSLSGVSTFVYNMF